MAVNVDEIQFEAMAYPVKFRTKEQAKSCFDRIQCGLTTYKFTVPKLIKAVKVGYPIRISVLDGGRSDENFKFAWLIGGDVDNKTAVLDADGNKVKGSDGKTLYRSLRPDEKGYLYRTKALARCRDYGLMPVCAYSTLSDAPNWPRFRLLFLLSRAVVDADELHRAVAGLLHIFPEMDQACSNVSRFSLGSNGEVFETYKRKGWEPCDPDKFIALAPKEKKFSKGRGFSNAMKRTAKLLPVKSKAFRSRAREGHVNIDEIRESFDLLGLMQRDGGTVIHEGKGKHGPYAKFAECPICMHHDCLVYYRDANIYKCFSDDHSTGGDVFKWVMESRGVSYDEALNIVGDLVG